MVVAIPLVIIQLVVFGMKLLIPMVVELLTFAMVAILYIIES